MYAYAGPIFVMMMCSSFVSFVIRAIRLGEKEAVVVEEEEEEEGLLTSNE